MSKGLIYKLIHEVTADNLTREVNNHLVKGWVMYGYPVIINHGTTDFYQAMVTERKDK